MTCSIFARPANPALYRASVMAPGTERDKQCFGKEGQRARSARRAKALHMGWRRRRRRQRDVLVLQARAVYRAGLFRTPFSSLPNFLLLRDIGGATSRKLNALVRGDRPA
ncbi:uncharacterized protein VTP21DRAFT_10162 [Calcarisporiella thermophila]|uniref:uncharacterized protein n=1 Tax=Calcarisporiella thermophila TaxID=911321 RepID=UPI00374302F6